MQLKKSFPSDTSATITVVAEEKELQPLKEQVLRSFQENIKVPGFRQGKVPLELVEKQADPQALQNRFLDEAVQQLYVTAVRELRLRPVDRPEVTLKKFVPFSLIEFEVTVAIIGEVKLADYTKVKKARPVVKIAEKDVQEVIKNLQTRMSDKKDVSRPAKQGDQVWIDFAGVDPKTKEPISGADGKDYPLVLGSNTFIPGFEPELIGLSADDEKTFTITFPKDYGAKALAGKKVTFTVTITKVQEVSEPKPDDDFATKAGPFKNLAELKADIKKQLGHEKQRQADREFESELVKEISKKSKAPIPQVLIDEQVERLMHDLHQNLVYRGQTIKEFLEAEGKTEEEYRKQVLAPEAADRVKASIVLAEIADKENLAVTPQEVDDRLEQHMAEYKDPQMQAELAKPEARQEISARILTEKTVKKIVGYATKA